ncbi:hypothetical protein [Hymenobacter sp. BRD67]|uniref:hypothetical protein n=1 Tax=Hymenobacter sp. BRD67 TaxID=2675877 RepID=UPI001567B909|nr:hypothetical protein [Hymenobacter sp. BRD67]QKG55005.1 hypothetical protein GKZ67_21515 [Hymenobacter sp. BRD67]
MPVGAAPFAQLGKQWLQNFMAVQFWSLTYSLLDTIYANYAATRPATGNVLLPTGMTPSAYANDVTYLINSIGFVILYCMVPWLTSFLIGSSTVQGFVGMFSGAVAGAAGAVSGVAFPGAFGGGPAGRWAANWALARIKQAAATPEALAMLPQAPPRPTFPPCPPAIRALPPAGGANHLPR